MQHSSKHQLQLFFGTIALLRNNGSCQSVPLWSTALRYASFSCPGAARCLLLLIIIISPFRLSKLSLLYSCFDSIRTGADKWISAWKKNGWKTASGQNVKNQVDIRRLDDLCQQIKVNWVSHFSTSSFLPIFMFLGKALVAFSTAPNNTRKAETSLLSSHHITFHGHAGIFARSQ